MSMLTNLLVLSSIVFETLARPSIGAASGSNHRFVWKGQTNSTLDESLRSNFQAGDFFYLLSGDTQNFYPCEADNPACLAYTPECKSLTPACIEKQSEWSNRQQKTSMGTFVEQLVASTGHHPKALVLNGDLIQTGTSKEVETYRSLWEGFDRRFPLYPGLGNHDCANNIGKCEHDSCVHRILSYFTKYLTEKVGRSVDMKNETGRHGTVISGSLAYSWDECLSGADGPCFHFVQQNNYPTYTRRVITEAATWELTPSLEWLRNDLKGKAGVPTVLNLHDFDTKFSEADKRAFQEVLMDSKADIVAVFFAHVHTSVGLRSHWCLKGHDHPVWHIYSGSVPSNNYVVALFSTTSKRLKALYKVHVVNETVSTVEMEKLSATCPGATKGGAG